MARLELQNVSKSFGNTDVLRGINLPVGDGEFCVFVGPSGCGKSTLLRLICGLDAVSDGQICIGGEVVNDVPAAKRGMAMVFQSYALYPHMNVAANMGYALRLAGMASSEIEKRVRETATVLHIEHLLERRPRELSGGQRQRVAIGRAIVREPRVFLFDEPLSNLDAALRVEMRFELARLKERLGTTTIYVTHDQTEAMTLADNIVVLNEGRVVQTGAPVELYERPANQFVAGFIGSPKMNFIPAWVEAANVVHVAGRAVVALATPGFAGTHVTLGIRPEHIRPVPPDARGVRAAVLMAERLGSDTFVYASVEGVTEPVLVRLGGNQPVVQGDVMGLRFDARNIHLFAQDGAVLQQEQAQGVQS